MTDGDILSGVNSSCRFTPKHSDRLLVASRHYNSAETELMTGTN